MKNIFSQEYSKTNIRPYKVGGFDFNITPRFKEHYVDSDKPYEWLTVKLFNAAIYPGSTAVDVGAHYGYYTLNAAREVGGKGQVISVEPVDFNRSILTENTKANGFQKNVKVVSNPISNTQSKVKFNITEASDNSGFYNHPNTKVIETIQRKSETLDGLLKKSSNISVIKIDAEGHEIEILSTAKNVLKRERPLLFLEFNPKCLIEANHQPEEMLKIILSLGYKIIFVDDKNSCFISPRYPIKNWRQFVPASSFLNIVAVPKKQHKGYMKSITAIFQGSYLRKN